eukprot:UN04061
MIINQFNFVQLPDELDVEALVAQAEAEQIQETTESTDSNNNTDNNNNPETDNNSADTTQKQDNSLFDDNTIYVQRQRIDYDCENAMITQQVLQSSLLHRKMAMLLNYPGIIRRREKSIVETTNENNNNNNSNQKCEYYIHSVLRPTLLDVNAFTQHELQQLYERQQELFFIPQQQYNQHYLTNITISLQQNNNSSTNTSLTNKGNTIDDNNPETDNQNLDIPKPEEDQNLNNNNPQTTTTTSSSQSYTFVNLTRSYLQRLSDVLIMSLPNINEGVYCNNNTETTNKNTELPFPLLMNAYMKYPFLPYDNTKNNSENSNNNSHLYDKSQSILFNALQTIIQTGQPTTYSLFGLQYSILLANSIQNIECQ